MEAWWVAAILAGSALVGVCVLYRWLLAAAYLTRHRDLTAPVAPRRARRFAAVIPAHDEEDIVAETIASLREAAYPRSSVEIFVIADNCTDGTATAAREAGATVYIRTDPSRRGKGFALAWAFDHLPIADFDALAVIDADCLVESNFFSACNRELERGGRALQVFDGLANPDETMLTRLIAVTNVMKNLIYSGGKTILGLSPPLMGTGMVFTTELLSSVPWKAFSLSEDVEQTFHLLEAGERVRFVPDAKVLAQEASRLRQAFSQRRRWAPGRAALASRARSAVATGLRRRDLRLIDAGISILMPTYSMLMNWTLLLIVASLPLLSSAPLVAALPWILAIAQGAEFAAGLYLIGANRRFVQSVALAPLFLLWKGVIDLLAAVRLGAQDWIRTQRHP